MFEGDARYIVFSKDSTQPSRESAISINVVAQADARNYRSLLALSTRSDIQDYEHRRTARQDPIDSVVFHLEEHDRAILHFLRRLLVACAHAHSERRLHPHAAPLRNSQLVAICHLRCLPREDFHLRTPPVLTLTVLSTA